MDPVILARIALAYNWIPIQLNGKRPTLPAWQKTLKQEALRRMMRAPKTSNVGVLTGKPSNIVVIDVDIKNEGIKKWLELLENHKQEMVETFTVLTGSGGYHYYYRYEDKFDRLHNGIIRGYAIDFKTTGGQIVMAGSIHPTTKVQYLVTNGYKLLEEENVKIPILATMPDFLYQLILKNQ